MRRKFSAPPIIVLLDVLFIFLFVSLLEQPSKIEIDLPENILEFDKSVRAISYIDGKKSYILNLKSSIWENYSDNLIKSSMNLKNNFFTIKSCSNCNGCCKELPETDGDIRLLITGDIYTTISTYLLSACLHNGDHCSNLKFKVDSSGNIDREHLIANNPIFEEILK